MPTYDASQQYGIPSHDNCPRQSTEQARGGGLLVPEETAVRAKAIGWRQGSTTKEGRTWRELSLGDQCMTRNV